MRLQSWVSKPAALGSIPRALTTASSAGARRRIVSGSRGQISRWCSIAFVMDTKAPWSSRRIFAMARSIRLIFRSAASSMSGRSSLMPRILLDLRAESHCSVLPRVRASQKPDKDVLDVEAPLPGGAKHAGQDRLCFCARGAAVPTTGHLAIDHGGAYGLFGRPIRRFEFGVVQIAEDRAAVFDDVSGELAVLVAGEVLGDQLVEAPLQFRCLRPELAASQTPFVPQISQPEAALEKHLEIPRKAHRAAPSNLLKQAGSPDKVSVAKLVDNLLQAVVRSPAISTEHSLEVAAQSSINDVEATAWLDHVERGFFRKRHEGPQPLSDPRYLPATFVGVDYGAVPDDDLDLSVEWLALFGCLQERLPKGRAVYGES